jgi:hypothetical protein
MDMIILFPGDRELMKHLLFSASSWSMIDTVFKHLAKHETK